MAAPRVLDLRTAGIAPAEGGSRALSCGGRALKSAPPPQRGKPRPSRQMETCKSCRSRTFVQFSQSYFMRHSKVEDMTVMRVIAATCALGLIVTGAVAQPAKTLKEQLIGTWDQVVSEATTPDGKKSFPFGEKPNGILIFTADGRFVQVHIASGIPKLAANSRTAGTADENKAASPAALHCSAPTSSMRKRSSSRTRSRRARIPIGTAPFSREKSSGSMQTSSSMRTPAVPLAAAQLHRTNTRARSSSLPALSASA